MSTTPINLCKKEQARAYAVLVEDDDGAMRLERFFDLLRIFLGYTLFEYLG